MKPKRSVHQPQRELFRIELSMLVDAEHPLVKAVLESFPGARIEAVRELDHAAPPPAPDDPTEEEEG